jgi:toxin ParE1/3/4
MALVFHPAAVDELDAAVEWYEARSPGVGARFYGQVVETLGLVEHFPQSGVPVDAENDELGGVRLFPMQRFPFIVVARPGAADDGATLILAVAHTRRDPGYWRERAD